MNEHQLLKNLENNSLVTSPPEETDATVDPQTAAETLRRSQRTRKLTAKGQELQDSKSKRLQHLFTVAYDKWKTQAKEVKKALNKSTSSELLRELVSTTCKASTDVKQTYEDLRQYCTPDGETRRRVDTCDAISKQIEEYASNLLEEKDKEQGANSDQVHWDGTSSVLSSAISSRFKSRSKGSKSASSSYVSTRHSSLCSAMKQDAAAELAATRATLQALKEIECEKQKLESLEVENKQRLALQEAENIARQNTLEEKRREILRLETVKQMNAAKARLQVYEQGDEEISELLYSTRLNQSTPVPKKERPPVQCTASPLVTQVQSASNSKPDNSAISLAEAIAESINSSRLPAPEPSIFTGDPLRYKDWKMSFQTLIGRKNIPVNEKVYYLRKYVGGSARKAIESYFLLSTDEAYHSAWEVLEERYGSPFVIAKAFRDKLNSWPKIGPKESIELREFSDFLRACEAAMSQVKCLEILNDCSENQKMITKLPDWLAARWNRKVIEFEEERKMFPTFNLFVDFVTREAKIACNPVTSLHALKSGDGEKMKTLKIRSVGAKVLTSNSEEASDTKSCIFCERSTHSLHTCRKFMERSVAERVKFVQNKKLCFGCLKAGHHSKNCAQRNICDVCKGKHPTCLHEDRTKEDKRETQRDNEKKESGKHSKDKERSKERTDIKQAEATSNQVVQNKTGIFTSTVVPVWLSTTSDPETELLIYALLDSQSDTTFILEEKANLLKTQSKPVQLKLSTMSHKVAVIPSQRLTGLQMRGFYSSKKITLPETYSRDFIPANLSHIPTPKTARAWPHLEHLAEEIPPLIECDVGLLIGYNCSQALLPREVVSGKDNEPFAQRTDLGWSIVGCVNPCLDYGDAIGGSHRVAVRQVTPQPMSSTTLLSEVRYICRTQVKELITTPDVLRVLESDFNERTGEEAHFSQEDLRFISIIEERIKINEDGHCEMPLPFKENSPNLPDNKKCAEHRLGCLKRRFERDKQYHEHYVTFMNETIAHKDAEKVPGSELNKSPAWYIPHHGVYHPQKPGKIRVVFDCSARFQGVSLNDHLLTGPDLTNTLIGVLCRFRQGPVAVMCDIERMFHQFHVRKEDQDYLRFLWWDNGDFQTQPSVYRMRVHLFGAASSPGCANYGLRHIAAQGRGQFSEASIHFIERNFYVDDGLISVSTKEEAVQLISESRQLCNNGKLRIHKFISNHPEVLASIPKEECAEMTQGQDLSLGEPQIERALGVKWCVALDQFRFRVVVNERPLSRRGVLSTVASIFDPLGLVAPFILTGKQILQQMCQDKAGWDELLSDELRPRWESWLLDLQHLADVKVQRCYLPENFKEVIRYELHHFSDASVTGYGECTYLRSISASQKIHCALVMGKARVAPTKITTVPRLELSAAVVAVRTSEFLRKELEVNAQDFFWTDSKVVLGYVNNDARRFHVFVANRVQRIKESTTASQWRHVTSEKNPADHASRGLKAKELISSNWLTGPDFLWNEELPSGDSMVGDIAADDPEVRKVIVHKTLATESLLLDRFLKFSSWTRLTKAVARLKRCVKEYKGLTPRTNEASSIEERKDAELTIIGLAQRAAFHEEIQRLQHEKEVTVKDNVNRLHRLNPFLDECGILRVGGRLKHAALHPYIKHPAILPKSSHISKLLIRHYHQQVQHQGRGMTMNELRSNGIWIVGCSQAVSSYIYKCVKCRKFRRSTENQKMADLPSERMEATPPFTYCGMDCFGPFYIKDGRKELKHYGLLFTCLCSRAVHIEVLDDMTSDGFINALRAFIALRGHVRQLRSDQGTNFVGARREFLDTVKEMNQECLKQLGCEFIFNTPSASHMGGIWERHIRTIRSVLASILDQSSKGLDGSSLRTYFYEIMAIINSRPLTAHLLNDPAGPQPLTPNHILTMKSSVILPPPGEFVREDLYLRKRWRRVQYLANEFWSRWKKEYLLNLQYRQKWHKTRRNARVNDIVIVRDDTAPRNEWKMAKVTKVYPDKDGCVRKLQLLISDSALDNQGKKVTRPLYLERPIHKTVTLLEAD
ncbi:uncharacterized protein LOC114435739 [Parambassis ranga]|uniref:Uncharacterized protein LOC114435739 n=1 Tax=Parambassis ranga TaxID=210632 RepID=A0A6P7IF06_9TELE|nr:uncharacterized protein LOC114435739 [Parambassis ranga]